MNNIRTVAHKVAGGLLAAWGHMRLQSLAPGFASGPVMRTPTASGAVAERGLPRELSPPPPVGEPVSVFADIRGTPLGWRVARITGGELMVRCRRLPPDAVTDNFRVINPTEFRIIA